MQTQNIRSRRTLLAAGLSLAALAGGTLLLMTARAQETAARTIPPPSGRVTPWNAMKIATARVPGRALSATFEFEDRHWIYGVIVVTNGPNRQLKEVELDATTGKFGDVETITPADEAKEFEGDLNRALGKATRSAPEKDEKDESGEKP